MGAPVTTSKALNSEHLEVEYPFKQKYGNFINGEFVEPKSGAYFENRSPITGEVINEIARSNSEDIESALDAAHSAFKSWKKTSTTERSNILLKIADTMETNLKNMEASLDEKDKMKDQIKKRWKYANMLLPTLLIIGFGLFRVKKEQNEAEMLRQIYD